MRNGVKKRAIIILLIAVYLLSVFNLSVFASDFFDVPRTHKNYLAVTKLTEMGVIAGYDDGSFCPEREITRTEFCALMARVLGYNKDTYVFDGVPFTDVSAGYWGEAYISFCYERQLVNGMGDGLFCPAEKVTMAQAVKMAVCAIGKENETFSIIGNSWYDGYVKIANRYNLFYKVDCDMDTPAIRADIAQIVSNMLDTGLIIRDEEKLPENEPIPEPDTEANPNEDKPVPDDAGTDEEEPKDDEPANENDPISAEIRAEYRKKDFLDVKTILIDAGHNYTGKDTGASNSSLGLKEEEITWQIADKLRNRLLDMGYNVVMTREQITDSVANTSVLESLQARVDLGHQSLADLFISIHCNAGGGSGTEVYCFSENGYAGRFAKIVQKNIVASTGLYNRGVKTANFFVIQNTLMPAILIETGFIDHQKDTAILSSQWGQNEIANAVANAVSEYDHMEITDFVQPASADIVTEQETLSQENTTDELRGTENEE